MRISHRYKFIFFANPKTGSESMRAMLDPYSDIQGVRGPEDVTEAEPFQVHVRPLEAREEFKRRGWPFEDYYRFTFVRNPWKRLASLYEMVRRLPPRFSGISFGEWLKASRTNGTGGGGLERYLFLKYGTYTLANFASDGSGKLLVDEVFRMEDMDTVPAILAKRGLPIPPDAKVPRNNVGTGKTPLHVLYTPELVELVRRRYAEDIERFGYSFD